MKIPPFLSADSIKAEFGGAFGSYQTNIRTPCMRQSLAPPGLLKWMSNKGWFLVVRVLFLGKAAKYCARMNFISTPVWT